MTIVGIAAFLKNPERLENNKPLRERLKELDFLGAFFLIPAVICLVLALQWGGTKYAWNSATIIGLFCGFGCLVIIFITIQIRLGDRATIPIRVFARRSVFFSVMFAFCVGSAFLLVIFYLPLYFQGVKGATATESGVHVLPLLLSVVMASVCGGGVVTLIGYFTPFMIAGMALFTIGCGLLSTLSPSSSTGMWFGYEIVAGVGLGMCLQVSFSSNKQKLIDKLSIIAVQTVVHMRDVPVATALVMFFQQLGGAIFIAIGQAVFQNKLIPKMEAINPSLRPIEIVSAGATGLKSLVNPDQLPAVLDAYAKSLNSTFDVAITMAGMAFFMACGVEFKSVKGKKLTPGGAA